MNKQYSDNSLTHAVALDNFNKEILRSFILCSKELHEDAINRYEAFWNNENKSKEPISSEVQHATMRVFINFMKSETFDDNKVNDYYKTCNNTINLPVFCFLLWVHHKKEAWLEILKHNPIDTNLDMYEACMAVSSILKFIPPNLTHTEEEKKEFIYYQKNYSLLSSLQQLPQNENNNKKPKI